MSLKGFVGIIRRIKSKKRKVSSNVNCVVNFLFYKSEDDKGLIHLTKNNLTKIAIKLVDK